MNAITLRKIPLELQEAIERRAEADGLSLNKAVQRMLEDFLGLKSGPARRRHHDLDELAGTWSRNDAEAFDSALANQRQMDPELWH